MIYGIINRLVTPTFSKGLVFKCSLTQKLTISTKRSEHYERRRQNITARNRSNTKLIT